ncbi:hypothetical protein Taro_052789 [Colocasia esculenta]|uniref:CCHC-type domain-containing protein n=1 Tax=Colocasia esculenta TaxID=4460 RepID=A0A843XL91_COLES|nr:hypothetical protein [Colocasia esculenta]
MAAQGHFEGQSVNRPLLFDSEDYTYWKTRMEFFLQGLVYQIWSIVEEGDLLVTNEKDKWTEDEKKKISLNCKAKSILCCALSKKEFNKISACKSAMEMWEKLRITYEGIDKVKETRIDILVTKYERFQMQPGESITQMFSRLTDITNGLASLGKTYEMGDMVRKILRSLPSSWTFKVTAIEKANDLKRMSLEKLIGSLMAHEINMERLGESSSRRKQSNALKAEDDVSEESSYESECNEGSDEEEAMLSRRLQRILAKKKKYQSGRRYFKKNKEFKKLEGKDSKKVEPICFECKKPRHIKAECPKLKKNEFRKKEGCKKFRKYKKKTMVAAWDNSSDSNSESTSSEEEEERANLAFMANIDDKERFATVKTKLCRHKAVDVADLQKNGMGSVVVAMERLKWTKLATLSEIVVPRSATFSTCTKADSDLMFWVIHNQSINMAEIIMERMKFASAQIWDKKTGVWTNTSVTEGEAIIGKTQEVQQEVGEAAVVAEVPAGPGVQEQAAQEEPQVAASPSVQAAATDIRECVSDIQEEQVAGIIQEIVEDIGSSERRIDDIPPKHLKPIEQFQVITPLTSMVGSVLRRVLDSIPSTQSVQEVAIVEEAMASSHNADVVMEEAPIQGEQEIVTKDVQLEDAPSQGEQSAEKEATS